MSIESIEQFENKQLVNNVEKAHSEALRADTLGRSLVPRVIKMVENGKSSEWPVTDINYMAQRAHGGVDFESTTHALNAELKKQKGANIEADLLEKWDGSAGDPAFKGFVEVRKVDGKEVKLEADQRWKA